MRRWMVITAGLLPLGCGGSAPSVAPSAPPVARASATSSAPAVPTASAAASSAAYSGHGASSVPPETLAKYPVRPLAAEVAGRLRALLDITAPGMGRLSPDARRLYFDWSVTGVPQVWRVDAAMGFPVQLTGGEDMTTLAGLTPDGKWLVIARDRKGEENPGLYLMAPDGGPLETIQHTPGVQTLLDAIADDSSAIYFSSNDRRKDAYAVYRWDVATRQRTALVTEEGLWRALDVHPSGDVLLRKATGALTSELWVWRAATQKLEPLLGQGEKEEHDAAFAAAPGEVLVRTNKLGEFRRLYRLVPGQGLVPVTPDVKADVTAFGLDRRRTRILYQTNEGGFTRAAALDARTYRPLSLPTIADADHVHLGATTPDSRYTTLGVDDGKSPLQAWVLDWKTGKLARWHRPSAPEIDTSRFARARLETYPARDGTPIPVLVRRPERCATDPCPVVVAFHGGPEAQAKPGFNVSAQAFVDAGLIFCEPNVRGSDGYGKAWLAADDGPKRLAIITDIEDAARWARSAFASGGKEPRVGVYGGSYGGYSVLMAMTRFAGAYDAGVDVVGISDLRTFLRNTAPYRRLLRISEYGDPERDAAALAELSPMTYVDRIRAPLLILQGATDPRVPAGEAVQIREALAARGVPGDLMIFPDEGHGARKRDNRVLMLGHSVAFLRRQLVGDGR